MASKYNQKIDAIFESKNVGFGSRHGPKMELTWRPKSRNFVDIPGYPPKTPQKMPKVDPDAEIESFERPEMPPPPHVS